MPESDMRCASLAAALLIAAVPAFAAAKNDVANKIVKNIRGARKKHEQLISNPRRPMKKRNLTSGLAS